MGKIKEFIKKYKGWLAIGMILGSVLGVLIIINISNNRQKEDIKNIQSPFYTPTVNLNINLQVSEPEIPKEDKVYKVQGDNMELLTSILQTFYKNEKIVDTSKETYLEFDRGTFSYSPNSRILTTSFADGYELNSSIMSSQEVEDFFSSNFGISKIKVTEENQTGEDTEYKGVFILKDTEIGSVYLEGNAFTLRINDEGEVSYLSVLLLVEQNVKEYQTMPISQVYVLIKNQRYPRMLIHQNIEDRYYNQTPTLRGSSVISEYTVKEISRLYLFNDSSNNLVLPMYKLEGDGLLINSKKEKFWSDTNVFICAVNPSFVVERKLQEVFSEPSSPERP